MITYVYTYRAKAVAKSRCVDDTIPYRNNMQKTLVCGEKL
jgi:hypothetical protein